MAEENIDALSQLAGAVNGDSPERKLGRTSKASSANEDDASASAQRTGDDKQGNEQRDSDLDAALLHESSASSSSMQSSTTKRRSIPIKKETHTLKIVGIVLLLVVSFFLLIPFVWAIGILMGNFTSDRDGADVMAKVMLVCGPVALALIAGAAFFAWQILHAKTQPQPPKRR